MKVVESMAPNKRLSQLAKFAFLGLCLDLLSSCSASFRKEMNAEIKISYFKIYNQCEMGLDLEKYDTIVNLSQKQSDGIIKQYTFPAKAYLKDSNKLLELFYLSGLPSDSSSILIKSDDSGIYSVIKLSKPVDHISVAKIVDFKKLWKSRDTVYVIYQDPTYKQPLVRDSILKDSRGLKLFKVFYFHPIHIDSFNFLYVLNGEKKYNPYMVIYYDSIGFINKRISFCKNKLVSDGFSVIVKSYNVNYLPNREIERRKRKM